MPSRVGYRLAYGEAAPLAKMTGSFHHHDLPLENPAMRTARFYTGLVILAGLAMAILMVIPSQRAASSGPVEGTVISHGRPLVGGVVFFTPEDPQDGEGMSARIDKDGHFRCDLRWRRDRATRMRFRIDIELALRNSVPDPPPEDPREIPEAGDSADHDRVGDGGRGPIRRIARASLRSLGWPSPRRVVETGRRRRSSVLRITEHVWLGPEPAHLDIDLKD
jgi:hypothetical protein